ncbi:glycosyltransferase family 2 protein [Sodalis sp. RH15]|uniref:glycosyltransferase family 2 protein n=1 Tax=Sodalis sp. RH15 TaxID=3394330 RepID=UPI0039B4E28F
MQDPHAINCSILVVVYNKSLEQSNTLKSMMSFKFKHVNLFVLNNGPCEVKFEKSFESFLNNLFDSVVLCNQIDNMPLSIAYNRFIELYPKSKKFVILDDDTILTQSFIDLISLEDDDCDLRLPRITSLDSDIVHYPVMDDIAVTYDCELSISKTISIGSGLVISSSLIEKFYKKKLKPFDEHFALYGVDFSFFRRTWRLREQGELFKVYCTSVLYHSLSRVEGDISTNRIRERLYDIALQARHYPSFNHYEIFFKNLIKYTIIGKFSFVFLILKIYFLGFHPRCIKYRNF